MKFTLLKARDMTPSLWDRWRAIQGENPELDSPYFSPEFTQIVSSVRDDVFVAVMGAGKEPRGFFPFQRRGHGFGDPVGSRLSDFHGLIAPRGEPCDVPELMRACGLVAWDFHAVPASQSALAPYHSRTVDSHFVDTSDGLEGYEAALRRSGSSQLQRWRSWRRKAAKDFKSVEFVDHVTDSKVLDTLLEWKSRQYQAAGTIDNWSFEWMRTLMHKIHAHRSDAFAGRLSALYFDGELAALHMGMRSRTAWHWWFPRFDERFEDWRPGLLLLNRLIEHAPRLGVKRIDLGYGDETYKLRHRSGAIPVAQGRIEMPSVAVSMRRFREGLESWVRRTPLLPVVRVPGRLLKRLERWKRYR